MEFSPSTDHTLLDLDAAMELKVITEKPRPYLGMSGIGHDCWRKLWLDFRLVSHNTFKAETLRNFADGHYSEDLTAERLNQIPGLELHTHDSSGKQFGFVDLGGHFRGHMDGAIIGIKQAPTSWHVWEHKCTNEAKFRKLDRIKIKIGDKAALAEWDFTYYVQGILYMHYAEMKRHYLTVGTSGSRKYTSTRTEANPQIAKDMIQKADLIIKSSIPLDRVSKKPDYFQCNWCPHKPNCHGDEAPIPTCRTCIHAKPVTLGSEGEWLCGKHKKNLTFNEQLEGCGDHIYIPQLLENFAEQTDATSDAVAYTLIDGDTVFWNGPNGGKEYTSKEIHNLKDKRMLGDENVERLRAAFDGEIVG